MSRKTIYMESAFWDSFSEYIRTLWSHESEDYVTKTAKVSLWQELFSFICRSNVLIDSSQSLLAEKAKSDPFLMHMIKCCNEKKMDLDEFEGPFPDIESNKEFEYLDDYFAIYFTEKDKHEAARRHGVINVCNDNCLCEHEKFQDTGVSLKRNKAWSWDSLKILKENSNSMVIVDNYILPYDEKNNRCIFRDDFKKLLKQVLPDSCIEEYHLSIFYCDKSTDRAVHKDNYYNQIISFLRTWKEKLSSRLRLELFPTDNGGQNNQNAFHDRTIVTNNIWVGSEAGFDLLINDHTTYTNTRVKKTTKTHGVYLGYGFDNAKWLEDSYDVLIEEARQLLRTFNYESNNRILK